MKKGFTLIELLAVIIVLAIILLIAFPVITNVIKNARKSAVEASAYGLIKAAENECLTKIVQNENEEFEIEFINKEIVSENKIHFSGDKPDNGQITTNSTCQVEVAVIYGEWCVQKEYTNRDIAINLLSEIGGECGGFIPLPPTQPLVTYTTSSGGSIEPSSREVPVGNDAQAPIVTPDEGYEFSHFSMGHIYNATGTGREGQIQEWVVPSTGTYRITAYGAQGGTGSRNGIGGLGAKMSGDFELIAGEKISILVGHEGYDFKTNEPGGGGGSFVTRNPENIVRFNGTSSHIAIPSIGNQNTRNLKVRAEIYGDSLTGNTRIVNTPLDQAWSLYQFNGLISVNIYGQNHINGTLLPTQEWTEIGFDYTNGQVDLYINGVIVNSFMTDVNHDLIFNSLEIGMKDSTSYFNGMIKNVQVEVDDILIAHYKLDQNDAIQILDTTINNYHGTGYDLDVITMPELLIAAGGGGGYGVGATLTYQDVAHATIEANGKNGYGAFSVGVGGVEGHGGKLSLRSGGGGGFYTDGTASTEEGMGKAYIFGGFGGIGAHGPGGYGGGGATDIGTTWGAAGGGGGYSGGGGGYSSSEVAEAAGGGGGSYNVGLNQDNESGVRKGSGLVIIDPLQSELNITTGEVTNVVADTTVQANFVIKTYEVTYTASFGGSVISEKNIVKHGSNVRGPGGLPDENYEIANFVIVEGNENGALDLATGEITNITGPMTIQVNFILESRTITFESLGNGDISPTYRTVPHGYNSPAPTINPNAGYNFNAFFAIIGLEKGTLNRQTGAINNVIGNITVKAEFVRNAANIFTNTNTGRTGTIQEWTVPTSGSYRITTYGAQGGTGTREGIGGLGARMSGNFNLTAGEKLLVLVGQEGFGGTTTPGGGGGSYVVKDEVDTYHDFNGTTSYVNIPNVGNQNTRNLKVRAEINAKTLGTNTRIVNTPLNQAFALYQASGRISVNIYGQNLLNSTIIPANEWIEVGFNYLNGQVDIIVDGTIVGNFNVASEYDLIFNSLEIGRRDTDLNFHGKIRNVRIEVDNVLIAEYLVDVTSAVQILDTSGNNYHGTGSDVFIVNEYKPLVIAGGGGGYGVGTTLTYQERAHAVITPSGQPAYGGRPSGLGGTDGNGGKSSERSGGGGGLLTNGVSIEGGGGRAFGNGGFGGIGAHGPGGFGGGGASDIATTWGAAGGGGGYSGGGGAYSSSDANEAAGGGGGSYNIGTSQVNFGGIWFGHGMVVIEFLN